MTQIPASPSKEEWMEILRANRGLIIFEAIALIILGSAAIILPVFFTFAVEIFVGTLLTIAGAVQFFRSFQARKAPGFWASLLSALIYLATGILLLAYPLTGVLTLTILLIALYLIQGAAQIAFGFGLKGIKNSWWLILSGVITLVLAGIILFGLPSTALWVIGLLVGINLVFTGFALLSLAFALPKQSS